MENKDVIITEVSLMRLGKRCTKMIEYIVKNQDRIEGYNTGNISFSFTGSTLKAKDENYEQL